jgi:hypothetical protein
VCPCMDIHVNTWPSFATLQTFVYDAQGCFQTYARVFEIHARRRSEQIVILFLNELNLDQVSDCLAHGTLISPIQTRLSHQAFQTRLCFAPTV